MKITVYIPCHNNESTIADVLESVRRQTRSADQHLFINDRCTDRSPQIARDHGFEVHDMVDGKGLPAARNRALKLATGDVIQGVDADVTIAPDYLQQLERKFDANPATGAIGGRLDEKFTDTPPDLWRSVHMTQHYGDQDLVNPPHLFGATTGCRVEAARKVGGWDERYLTSFEDVDMSRRLSAAGFGLLYTAACRASHLRRDTRESVLQNIWKWNFFGYERDLSNLERFIDPRLPMIWRAYRRMRMFDIRHPSLYPITLLVPWSWMIRDLFRLRETSGESGEIRNVIDICRGALQFSGADAQTVERAAQWLNQLVVSLEEKLEVRPSLPPAVIECIKFHAMESLMDRDYWTKARL
jgi:glycosyltransferase involved in cell wall biosynthesis